MGNKVILVGGFHEIIELCEDCGLEIVGIIDSKLKGKYEGVDIIGTDDDRFELFKKYGDIPLVLTPDKPEIREKLYHLYKDAGFCFKTIVSPRSRISRTATIGEGTIIQDSVNVSSHTKIGDFVKLNTMSNVMHDCMVGNFTTIAPNVCVLGRIGIGDKCYIGANATVLPDVKIVGGTTIGAGATVLRTIEEPGVYIGTPTKLLKKDKI